MRLRGSRPRTHLGIAALVAGATLLGACAIPGRLYLVAPRISGHLATPGEDAENARLSLRIRHRETPNLHHTSDVPLSPEGDFSFDAVRLAIAGHEYSKFYRAYLHLRVGGKDRVIWRAEFSRRQLGGPIQLACSLARPVSLGQPCQVVDPLEQPWLIASGRRTFDELCATCHGTDGGGTALPRPGGSSAAADLRYIAARRGGHFDRAEIAEWVEGRSLPTAHGSRDMPIWGERLNKRYERYVEGDALIGVSLDPVVVFLESLQRDPPHTSPP